MLSSVLLAKFQRIIASDSASEYLQLTAEERKLFERWKSDVVAA